MLETIETRLAAVSDARVARLRAAVVREAEAVPGVTAVADGDGVVLSGRGLQARVLGTRDRAADPRLAGLLDAARSAA